MLDDVMREVQAILGAYGFIRAVADLDRTDNALRFRLIIDETVFIQVYANSTKCETELRSCRYRPANLWPEQCKEGTGTPIHSLLGKVMTLKARRESQ